jgi:hypothetical protein
MDLYIRHISPSGSSRPNTLGAQGLVSRESWRDSSRYLTVDIDIWALTLLVYEALGY